MTDEHLTIRPSPERWPTWATVGHTACQRVSWLCGFASEPGAETTPVTDALHYCRRAQRDARDRRAAADRPLGLKQGGAGGDGLDGDLR